ncbi:MAG TPA: tripartite tricarboxylate transporter substrate binding protein [Xanthobacteraceae bacterium]|nr:tripartite tricarboxylate transporter substrate binding protein [Xanthobacteraceae bacterium]
MRFRFPAAADSGRRTVLAAALALATGFFAGAPAQAAWPDHPITVIVCFPAGGGTDTAVRMINTQLGKALGQPVIIENRAGAGGNIGITAAARAKPDGYTFLGCSSAFVVNPSLYANATYDPFKDFEPVMVFGAAPNVIVVPKDSPIKTFQDFVAKAKANPGKLNYTSSGVGTTPYLGFELVKLRLGLNVVHIPFAGAGPATQAALAGQVDVYTANLGSLGALIAAGSLRPIVQTGEERWPELPDVPTLAEVGIKNAETDTFQGLYAPAGVPKPIIDRLVQELSKILADPDIKAKYMKSGLGVLAHGPEKFKERIAREVPMYKEIIDKAGLKIK